MKKNPATVIMRAEMIWVGYPSLARLELPITVSSKTPLFVEKRHQMMALADITILQYLQKMWHQVTPSMRNILAGVVLASCAHQAVLASPTPPPAPAPLTFAVGDKLKVSFYEPFNNDAKWAQLGQVREPGPSFYLHDELSGDYTVASDWTISLPIIGNVVVAHRTTDEVEAILDKDFMKVVGHPGFVNISIAARKPFYILGFVNKPGVYPFEPDMTPLDLVALAGGYKTTPLDVESSVEAIHESASETAELDQLRDALAQCAVVQAEINNTQAEPPQQLVDLMGKSGADALVQEEQANRQALVQTQTAQAKALQSAVDAAETIFVTDQGRLQPMKDGVAVLLARLSSLKTLSRDGMASELQIDAAQGAALDSQDRQQDVLAAIAADQHQLVLAKIALAEFVSNNELGLNQQLADQQREIDNLTPQVAAGAEVIKLLTSQDAPENSSDMQFSVVREGQLVAAGLTTGLQPGDVLQVEAAPSEPASSTASSAQPSSGAPLFQQSPSATCPQPNGCF
jgi:protein involved in polysaccharide export with SLBB domain